MTRRGHLLFGLGVTAVTAVSIWFSVAIPVAGEQQARAQVNQLLSQVPRRSGDTCPLHPTLTLDSPYLKSAAVARDSCTVTLQLSASAPVERSLRDAQLTLVWNSPQSEGQQAGWRCEARGGHNANQADFPSACHFSVQDPLL